MFSSMSLDPAARHLKDFTDRIGNVPEGGDAASAFDWPPEKCIEDWDAFAPGSADAATEVRRRSRRRSHEVLLTLSLHGPRSVRAIRAVALERLATDDPTYGWTVQTQVRASARGLAVMEDPVDYRRRI